MNSRFRTALLGVFIVSSVLSLSAQTAQVASFAATNVGEKLANTSDLAEHYIYSPKEIDVQPSFVGGEHALKQYIRENLVYPIQAIDYGIEGKVHVEFTIDRNGHASNPHVYRTLGFGCDEEVERMIMEMPRWKPGIKDAKSAATKVHLSLGFSLNP